MIFFSDFFSLFSTALSSVFYGFIITFAVMAILYAILKALSNGIVQTAVFFYTGVILFMLLVVQFSLLVGAIEAKDAADAAEVYLRQVVEDKQGTVSIQESQQAMDAVTSNFPIIGSFLNIVDFSGHDVSDLPEVMHETMTEFFSSYIWHRVWWILGFIAVACVVVVLYENNDQNNRSQARRRVSSVEQPHHRRRKY